MADTIKRYLFCLFSSNIVTKMMQSTRHAKLNFVKLALYYEETLLTAFSNAAMKRSISSS